MRISDNNIKNIKRDIVMIEKIERVNYLGYGNPNYKIDVLIDDDIIELNTIDDYAMNYKIDNYMIGKSFSIEYVEYKNKQYIIKI